MKMKRFKIMSLIVMVSLLAVGGFPFSASAASIESVPRKLMVDYCHNTGYDPSTGMGTGECNDYKNLQKLDLSGTGWTLDGQTITHDVKPGDTFPALPLKPTRYSDTQPWRWGTQPPMGFVCSGLPGVGGQSLAFFGNWNPVDLWGSMNVPPTIYGNTQGIYTCRFGYAYNLVTFKYGTQEADTAFTKIRINTPVAQPEQPVRDGYNFKGWYKDGVLYDFSQPVEEDIILEARWEPKTISSFPMTGSRAILILLFLWVFLAVFWLVSWLLKIRRKQ